jgi:hypothetical protein
LFSEIAELVICLITLGGMNIFHAFPVELRKLAGAELSTLAGLTFGGAALRA